MSAGNSHAHGSPGRCPGASARRLQGLVQQLRQALPARVRAGSPPRPAVQPASHASGLLNAGFNAGNFSESLAWTQRIADQGIQRGWVELSGMSILEVVSQGVQELVPALANSDFSQFCS